MSFLFHELLYRPLFNLITGLYNLTGDLGIAIILVTILVRVLMLPLYKKNIQSQREMTLLQPKIKELQEKYKDDKTKLSESLLNVYKEHNINPFSGFILLFAQLPVIIAIYRVAENMFKPDTYPTLYSFISLPESFNNISLGFVNIAESGNLFLALLVGISQYYQISMMIDRNKKDLKPKKKVKKSIKDTPAEPDIAQMMNTQMKYMMPVLVTVFAFNLQAAMSFYWIASTSVTIIQEYFIFKKLRKSPLKIKS